MNIETDVQILREEIKSFNWLITIFSLFSVLFIAVALYSGNVGVGLLGTMTTILAITFNNNKQKFIKENGLI